MCIRDSSNAILENNASFDTFGAGYVAETGNETGAWNDNIAINAQGVSWGLAKGANNYHEFDIGKTGDGFWFSGRMVESSDNVAASVNHGYIYFHRGPNEANADGDNRPLEFDSEVFAFDEALTYDDAVAPNNVPILVNNGNETFASHIGMHVVKANPVQGHDIHSVVDDFTAWNIVKGIDLEYTSHYILNDIDLIAVEGNVLGTYKNGIAFGTNTFDMIISNSSVVGFQRGIDLNKHYSTNLGDNLDPDHEFVVVNTSVTDSDWKDYRNYDPELDTILDGPITPAEDVFVTLDGPLLYSDGKSVVISGTKTDSLGTGGFPRGPDN